jgi:hypothetical protein
LDRVFYRRNRRATIGFHEDAVTAEAQVGSTIGGRYRVLGELGRGGMAIVYRVQDARGGALLALKRGVARDEKRRARRQALLAREYHTLCQLAHPRIIEVYDYGVDEDGPYYVMELLDGGDLDPSRALPFRDACALLRDVASSLAILHARGLIHRDISGRNVRRTADGRAKLIDFGTMASMGPSKEVVGTPPFMAPEVVQLQPLDARADLFSLGALAYRLLTGRHAYPARRIRELRDVWRTRPAAPARISPEVPVALSELVMQLLALDRNARAHSAAEVISRLCAIAELPFEENIAVSNAYLTTPVLVGRERALVSMRKSLLALGRQDGGALLIEGDSGSGRSRLLDACAIEAKLLGAAVLRADAADVGPGDYGVMRVLLTQLIEQMPNEVTNASRLSRPVLASVLDDPPGETNASPATPAPDRSLIVRELRELMLALSRKQRLLIAVDDFDQCDAASMAAIAAIACKAERHPLIVALVIDRQSVSAISPVQRLLRSVCEPIALDDLSQPQSEALLRSVFGDVANLSLVAGRIHALAQGNPRTTMELAQHLVSKGLVRHEAGAFSLPDALDEHEMPHTLASSLRQRLSALSSDARELCQVVHVTEGDAFGLADYAGLTPHGDEARVFAALDELVAARVLIVEGDRYRFSQRGLAAVVAESLPAGAAALLHARVARVLSANNGNVLRRVHHLLESGASESEAVELLSSLDPFAARPPLPLLKRAVACADRLGDPARHALRMALLVEAQAMPDIACFQAYVAPLIAQLEHNSGLSHYRELGHLPEPERLGAALAAANEAYLAKPERERGFSVIAAIQQLGQLSLLFNSVATWTLDLDTWDQMPSLLPLEPLSPAIGVVNRFADAMKGLVQGRFLKSGAVHEEVLDRVSQSDRAGLEQGVQSGMQVALHLLIGLRTAGLGLQVAEDHAREVEKDRMLRVSAWRIRQVLHTARGDAEEARRCMRLAELLQLQIGGEQYAVGATFSIELPLAAMMGDMAALKTAIERMSSIAERLPGWRPLVVFGQSRLRLLQGDAAGALAQLLPAFELAPAGQHWCFILLCEGRLAALNGMGRFEETIAIAIGYLELLEREGLLLVFWGSHLTLHLSLALSKAGRHEEAARRTEGVIANIEAIGTIGFMPGLAYETRARIALAASDFESFDRYAERCAREYCRFKNPVLGVRLARLSSDARAAAGSAIRSTLVLDGLSSEVTHTEYHTVYSRMRECNDTGDRARCALTILLQHTESFGGYLYGVGKDGLTLLAGLPDAAPESGLESWLRRWTTAELAALEREPVTAKGGGAKPRSRPADNHFDAEGRRFEPILLFGRHAGDEYAAAVLVMHVADDQRAACDRGLLACVAAELLDGEDVSGVLLEDVSTETGNH